MILAQDDKPSNPWLNRYYVMCFLRRHRRRWTNRAKKALYMILFAVEEL